MSVLRVRNVARKFGSVTAVDGVSLHVKANEILGVVGPNGAGKTSLFNIISGYIAPSGGDLYLGEDLITQWPIHRRVRAGLARTFQTPQLFRESSVIGNVMSGTYAAALSLSPANREAMGALSERADEALKLVGLSQVAALRAGELAYPAQKRLEIARALMTNPSVLLLDEPAAGMNESEAVELAELIQNIRAKQRSVVVIEHNMRLIMEVCDRVTVVNFGKVISEGTPTEVRSDAAVINAYLGASS